MRTVRLVAAVILLLAALAAVPGSATAQDRHGHEHPPDQIALPDGWQPEGITTDGRHLYVGSLADGAIWRADARTGAGEVLAAGAAGRVAVGLDYDRRRDLLWVAGGPTGEVRAQDADTGEVLATYAVPSTAPGFLNDLVVTPRAVYVTDSFNQELGVIPFARGGHHRHHGSSLPPETAATTLPLTGDLVYQEGFNLNGIVRHQGHLLAVQSNTGLLFDIRARTGDTRLVDLGATSLVNGDGLESGGCVLYVARNLDNLVPVLRLSRGASRGTEIATLEDPALDVPSTIALTGHSLWAVNARFTTPPTPDTAYSIVRLDAVRGCHHRR